MSPADPERPVSPIGRGVVETIGFGAWLLAAAGWLAWSWSGDWLFGPLHLATAFALVIGVAALARRGWVRLFGPVLFYEGLRAARRNRFFFLRTLYAVGLLLLLLWVHWLWSMESPRTAVVDQAYKQQAKLAQEFFYAFAIVQFAVVVLLTPAYVAGGVAEEKEKRTLEFLLATDLRGREIVFGKLLARLGNLALFVMTGLPVLSIMQFFGGIDPGLLLASFAVTALTAGSLAALGILMSVQRRRARDAIILTYLAAAGYVAIASLCLAIPPLLAEYRGLNRRAQASGPAAAPSDEQWVKDSVEWLNSGNPFYGLGRVVIAFETGGPFGDVVEEQLERYALFHGLFMAACVGLAVLRLRPVALAQAGAAPKRKLRFEIIRRRRRPVRDWPMLWKEIWIEGGLRFGWMGRILVGLVVGISFIPFVIIVYIIFERYDSVPSSPGHTFPWDRLGTSVNGWVRSVNTIVSTLMLLGVAVRAAGAIGGERDRDTLISLMTTPLTTAEIVWAKLAGSLMSVRLFLIWLGVVWAIGLVCGGVGILAVPLQVILWLFPAAFVAALGLYCSAACKTTLRATTWTIFGTLFVLGGHWVLMGMCCFAPLSAMSVNERDLNWLFELEAGLSPPFVFFVVPYRELSELRTEPQFQIMIAAAQVIWLGAAAVVGHLAHEKFRQATNRRERAQGQPPPLPPLLKTPTRHD